MTRNTSIPISDQPETVTRVLPPRRSWLDNRLYPFESHYTTVADCTVHYLDEGNGPAMLFLHGNAVWSFTYRHLISDLRDRFRCVAPDFPDFGLSTAPAGYRHTLSNYSWFLEEFIERLNLRDIVLFAHDSGGPIGLGVAARHPEWFRAAILLDTFCFPLNGVNALAGMLRLVSSRFPGALLIDYLNLMIDEIPRQGMKLRTLFATDMAALRGPFRRRSARYVMRELFASVLDEPEYLRWLQQQLRGLDLPTLLLPAGKSGAVERLLPRLRATLSRHEVRILQGAGHFSQEDAPDQIISAIRSWTVLKERS